MDFIEKVSPTKLVDGAWLYGTLAHWQDLRFRPLIDTYLDDDVFANVKALVLGCTHYPLISAQIEKALPDGVQIIDSAGAVALALENLGESLDLHVGIAEDEPQRRFIVSDLTQSFQLGAEMEHTLQYI